MSTLNLQPPRVALADPKTGMITREWYRYITQLQERLGGTVGLTLTETSMGEVYQQTTGQSMPFVADVLQPVSVERYFEDLIQHQPMPDFMPDIVQPSTSGTVTSVAQTVPAEFAIAGSPITSSGTLAITKATQTANTVWAGPTSGSAAQPAFRALVGADLPALTWNQQTGSYTLVLTDGYDVGVAMNVGSANNLTIPPNSSVAFPVGTSILVYQEGAGLTSMVAGVGVTILKRSPLTLNSAGQYAMWTIIKRATDTWILTGDLA